MFYFYNNGGGDDGDDGDGGDGGIIVAMTMEKFHVTIHCPSPTQPIPIFKSDSKRMIARGMIQGSQDTTLMQSKTHSYKSTLLPCSVVNLSSSSCFNLFSVGNKSLK